eukprot:6230615-Amphidinium_carterae.1
MFLKFVFSSACLRHELFTESRCLTVGCWQRFRMRNPNNWTEECNHIPPWEKTSNTFPDVRFRLAIEPVSCIDSPESVHHYVSIYVALTTNPDYEKNQKLKRYKGRRTPYPDYLRAARDPTVNSTDRFVMETIETEHLGSLPMNLIWCYDELNLYARTRDFSWVFQMEFTSHYESSIRQLCQSSSEYTQLRDLFFTMDQPYGPPDHLDVPAKLLSAW